MKTNVIAVIVLLCVAAARAQQSPVYVVSVDAMGTHGDPALPRVGIGETAAVAVSVMNFGNGLETVSVESVAFVMHHGSGAVATSNLLEDPVAVPCWGIPLTVTSHFVAAADDPDILSVDCLVVGTYDPDGAEGNYFPRQFQAQVAVALVVSKPGPPTLNIAPSGPDAVTVRWSIACEEWELEASRDFNEWLAVTTPPAIQNGAYTVTVDARASSQRMFRLRKYVATPAPAPMHGETPASSSRPPEPPPQRSGL